MTPSIRTFLLINLLLSVTLITSLAIIGNLFLAHQDIQSQLDIQLIRSSMQLKALVINMHSSDQKRRVEKNIIESFSPSVHIPSNSSPSIKQAVKQIKSQTVFQVWDKDDKLMLHSTNGPRHPLSKGKTGFSTVWLHGTAWRVYTNRIPQIHTTLMLGEQSNFREHLENQLTQDSIFIMLITYPFLGLLIWIIVGRGLDPLQRIARAMHERAARNLQPVKLESVPSEIKPLVDELNHLFKRLTEAFEREKRFAGDAAHELRTPLAGLKTQVQVALKALNDEERERALSKVVLAVNRSTHVIQQLLTLSRMMPDASINKPEHVNLNDKALETVSILMQEARNKEISLSLKTKPKPAYIFANETSIGILLRNLIDNAIRYTPEGGTVDVVVSETKTEVVLDVIDSGPGIPPEMRHRVFERFFRVIGNKASGSGLGLGIVQQITKLHNAKIHLLTPDSGQGLKFQIRFKRDKRAG